MTDIEDSGFPSLGNVASRLDPNGDAAIIANLLEKKKPMISDIPWVEGNLATGHRITQAVNALPTAAWRQLNEGIAATKGETAQYDETCGMLEDESKIDEAVAELNGGETYRRSEGMLKMEGFAQQFATAAIYESVTTNPERIHGLTPRYPATTGYSSSGYVLAGTNSGSNCHSIWLIRWAPRKLYGIYPKGTKAGLERVDKGLERVQTDATSLSTLYAWVERFKWRCGIAVEDYRYAVRFQWDPDDAAMADEDRGVYLKMQTAIHTIFDPDGAFFYMNRTSMAKLHSQLASNDANFLTYLEKGGRTLPAFMGIPIRVDDTLVAETAIS